MSQRKQLPAMPGYEVVVVGGGVAGVAAALAAARMGKKVLLVERTCALGGLATVGLVNLFVPMCNGRGIPIMRGMVEEFLRDAAAYGFDSLNYEWQKGYPDHPTNLRYVSWFSPGILALLMVEKLHQAGVEIIYNAVVADVVMTGSHCDGVEILCEEGMRFCPAAVVVDASGTSVVFDRAGAETELGENYFTNYVYTVTLERCADAVAKGNIRYASGWYHGGNASLYGTNHPADMPFIHGDTSANISDYLVKGQLKLWEKLKGEDRLSRNPLTLPAMPQLRKVRRICGAYTMSDADLFCHFDDAVTAVCDSERRDSLYEIPYRALYCKNLDNLLAAGRNISASGWLWDVTRVIPPAIVTGQAAGVAAALAVEDKCAVSEVDIARLQAELTAQNVLVHFDDAWVPANRQAGEYSPGSHSSPDRLAMLAAEQNKGK